MTLSQSPVEGVGKAVLAEVAESVVLNLEGRDVGYLAVSIKKMLENSKRNIRDWEIASSENASMKVGS